MNRCSWASKNALMIAYHDTEWGVPVHDEFRLFEYLTLEGAQAGLSWMTILAKRKEYRKAFLAFDPYRISEFGEETISELLNHKGIVRNKAKIFSVVQNARMLIAVVEEYGSFDSFIWNFVKNKPVTNVFENSKDIPAFTSQSQHISEELKRRGFKFVGPTITYSFMQAAGLVNDHVTSCFRHEEISENVYY